MKPTQIALIASVSVATSQHAMATSCLHHKPQLAVPYENEMVIDWQDYVYSEKLDGIRAYWSGKFLFTRQGNLIYAPSWFTDSLPPIALEGELWIGRGQFEETMATVMDSKPDEKAWRQVRFMVFDLPASLDSFDERYQKMKGLTEAMKLPHLGYVTHYPIESEMALRELLASINRKGGEGLMLRKRDGIYMGGRSSNVIKMKVAEDAEAEVIGHIDGKGKHVGRLGALLVKMPDGKEFKIGTGFSDNQRENPPEIGAKVTYRYNGFTKNGIPKFARYLHVDVTKQ